MADEDDQTDRLSPGPSGDAITGDCSEAGLIEVPQHDGSMLHLCKLDA